MLGIQAKEFNFGFIRPDLVSHDWWSAAEMVVLLEGSPISKEELWSSVSDNWILGHLFDQGPAPRLLSLAGRPALGRVLVVPNFFH
jgi:hypothetical protein